MIRLAPLFVALTVLAGCASSMSAQQPLSRYQGQLADAFFTEWGAPVARRTGADGWTMFLWFSGRNSIYVPGHTDSELIGNTAWWEGSNKVRYDPRVECRVRIVVDPQGVIRDILLHESSNGWWESFRCAHIFGPPLGKRDIIVAPPPPAPLPAAPSYGEPEVETRYPS